MTNILMVIKTTGLKYDDRLRKECLSLQNIAQNVKIIALEYENRRSFGRTDKSISFQTISLYSRYIFHHKKGILFKTIEMYFQFLFTILNEKPDTLWLHNIEMAGLVPLGWVLKKIGIIRRLVWDQHELPMNRVFDTHLMKIFFRFLLNLCDTIISANRERSVYLTNRLKIVRLSKYKVIENFVDEKFIKLRPGKLPVQLISWLDGQDYIIAQGGANPGRYMNEVIAAIMEFDNLKLVVVGPFESKLVSALKIKYHNRIDKKVFFTGMIPQLKLVNYIDNALAGIILYTTNQLNSKLCAPNRLYQAIARGIPVIVGSNPPMTNVVSKLGNGTVLLHDGRDETDILEGIVKVIDNIEIYNRIAKKSTRKIKSWENQSSVFMEIISDSK